MTPEQLSDALACSTRTEIAQYAFNLGLQQARAPASSTLDTQLLDFLTQHPSSLIAVESMQPKPAGRGGAAYAYKMEGWTMRGLEKPYANPREAIAAAAKATGHPLKKA